MLENLRIALLISLSILLVVVLFKRLKRTVMLRELPAKAHTELLGLDVMYHPARLRIELFVAGDQEVLTRLLDAERRTVHDWPSARLPHGDHVIELDLGQRADGPYFLEVATPGQRTERAFKLRQA